MVWIFVLVITFIMCTLLMTDESILEDAFFGNSLRNSSFVIHRCYGMAAVFGCLMVAAFVNSAASREFSCHTDQLIFTKPISKLGYLLGRFVGAMIISLIPALGVSLAVLISPWATGAFDGLAPLSGKWGPTEVTSHLSAVCLFAVPNTFFLSAVVFAIAVWTRSALASFIGILGVMVALSISNTIVGSLENESLAALADPFGENALATMTKYWTVSDKNTQPVPIYGLMLWNRLVWITIGSVLWLLGCFRFSFTIRQTLIGKLFGIIKSSVQETFMGPAKPMEIPLVEQKFGWATNVRQLFRLTVVELWSTLKSPVFICLMVGTFLLVSVGLSAQSEEGFGVSSLPVTFVLVQSISEPLETMHIVLITFFAGVFVWKERDAKLDEVFDALPFASWISYLSKFIALLVIVSSVILMGIFCAVFYQATSGFFNFKLGSYFQQLFMIEMSELVCLMVLAILFHVISPNKYVGYFAFVGFLVINSIAWPWIGIESNMVSYGTLPSYMFSDMFGIQPFVNSLFWFALYWLLLAAILAIATGLLWQRGRDLSWAKRISLAFPRWRGGLRWTSLALIIGWFAVGGFVYWNTEVLNAYDSEEETEAAQADYETQYKNLADQLQPRVTQVKLNIDLYPERRGIQLAGQQTLQNKESKPIEKIFVTTMEPFESTVKIEGGTVETVDEEHGFYTFVLNSPMQPGDTRQMEFEVSYQPEGFENSLSMTEALQNGTFFNNLIVPQVGYFAFGELTDQRTRDAYGLGESSFVPLDQDDAKGRRNSYISSNSDWVDLETTISTSADQIAIAPGSLKKKWQKDGRNFFHYQLDHPSLNFYSIVSADYKVESRRWKDVDIEVYYHPEHEWNVDLMLKSVRSSLEYYSEAFGPYKHKQARIIEFPRLSSFAQAFPGTMPYSEGIGFIADLKSEDDIDKVFYIVAHEMAHQWWAHQVVGANMQGATILSETLAQYSALMVMEKEYGRDMMRKFLKYELDNYLRGRGREQNEEFALQEMKATQAYIHYNKGSVAMYQLKETIGEEKLNAALRAVVDKFAYQPPPYPTSLDLLDAIREQTPIEHQSLIDDLFAHITLFENRTESATYEELEDGKFKVTLNAEFKKLRAASDGKETEVPLNDWIEIGAFGAPDGRYGESLHRKRVRVTESKQTFEFIVDKKPHKVGVDPFTLLVDRNSADNMKKPVLTATPSKN